MAEFFLFNETFGQVARFDHLPEGVRLGLRNIGPSWNNTPAPVLFVTDNVQEMHQFLINRDLQFHRRIAWTRQGLQSLPLNIWPEE